MIRVNIIAWHNGGGLSRDVDILANALPTDTFDLTLNCMPIGDDAVLPRRIYHRGKNAYRLLSRRLGLSTFQFDINLFLEDIVPGFYPYARRNAFLPNPEWFKSSQARHLKGIDAVLCKTRNALETYAASHDRTKFVSFTSEDRLDHSGLAKPEEGFLHLAGRSWQKGTGALTDLWLNHPEWPVLRVVQNVRTYNQSRVTPIEAPNIDHILERLDNTALKRLQNTHAVHLCPSEVEGFGHVIAEAMSCRALTLTTNAPPMNELVTEDRGILVEHNRVRKQRAGMNYYVDPTDLERKVLQILDMDGESKRLLGENARVWFENNDKEFRRRIKAALLDLV